MSSKLINSEPYKSGVNIAIKLQAADISLF